MTVTVLVSAKGSPGVTTSALALAAVWPRRVLLAECDPAGGDIVAGLLQATAAPTAGLLELALAARRGLSAQDVLGHCLRLATSGDGILLLPGLTDPGHAAAMEPMWPQIASAMRDLATTDPPYDVLVDAGRLPTPPELLTMADRVLLVIRPTLLGVHHARPQLAFLRRHRPDNAFGTGDGTGDTTAAGGLGVLLVGDRPYPPGEVRSALQVPVMAVMAHDPRAATALSDGTASGRWFDRSPLIRTARQAAAALSDAPGGARPAADPLAAPDAPGDPGQLFGQHSGQPPGPPVRHAQSPTLPMPDRRVAP